MRSHIKMIKTSFIAYGLNAAQCEGLRRHFIGNIISGVVQVLGGRLQQVFIMVVHDGPIQCTLPRCRRLPH